MANLMPLPKMRFTNAGRPLVGGKVFFYVAGTTTPKNTFKDRSQATANSNPVILDSNGEADIWLEMGYYKVVLKTSTDVVVWTVDGVAADANGLNIDDLSAAVTAAQASAGVAAAAVSGSVNTFFAATKAAGDTLAASLADGATVIVDEDEAANPAGVQTRRTVSGGVLSSIVSFLKTGAIAWKHGGTGAVWRTLYARLNDLPVSVLDFIPVAEHPAILAGTSTYDCTADIQAAIDVVSASGGSGPVLPNGRFMVDMIGFGVFLKDNVRLVGQGPGSLLKGIPIPGTSNFVYVVSIAGCSNAGISNCTIDASRPVGETDEKQWHGIRLDGDTYGTIIEDLEIKECKGDGLWIVKNPGFSAVPNGALIRNVRVSEVNRQDIALVEGDGLTITQCTGTGTLDVESDSPSGRVNQNHIVTDNSFDKIRISPLTGLSGAENNIITANNKCNELSIWGVNKCVFDNNIVNGPIVLSQSGSLVVNGGSCSNFAQNVTNGTNVSSLEVNDLKISSATATVGYALKDVVIVNIKGGSVTLTASGSFGLSHANNSSQAGSIVTLDGVDFNTASHCVNISSAALTGGKHVIKKCTLKSTSGRSISKDGASTAGEVELYGNDIYAQPVIRRSTKIKSNSNRYHDVASINFDNNTGATSITVDGDRYYGTVPTCTFGSNTLSGSFVLRDIAGEDVTIGASKFVFTSTTASDVLIDNVVSSSATPFTGLSATIRSGSLIRITGSATRYGIWYNGTSWVDLA